MPQHVPFNQLNARINLIVCVHAKMSFITNFFIFNNSGQGVNNGIVQSLKTRGLKTIYEKLCIYVVFRA